MKRYALTQSAYADLDNIPNYLQRESGADVVRRFRRELFAKLNVLASFPGLGHQRPELTTFPLAFFTVDPYLVVYDRHSSPIIIHAVLHVARNVKHTLNRRDIM